MKSCLWTLFTQVQFLLDMYEKLFTGKSLDPDYKKFALESVKKPIYPEHLSCGCEKFTKRTRLRLGLNLS